MPNRAVSLAELAVECGSGGSSSSSGGYGGSIARDGRGERRLSERQELEPVRRYTRDATEVTRYRKRFRDAR